MRVDLKASVRKSAALLCILALTACGASTLKNSHGYIPDNTLLAEVRIGTDTKDTVDRLLGLPSTQGIIDDSGWYYVKSDYERFLWRAPVEVDREVLSVSFSEAGVVENIERFGLEDGRVVALSRRVTSSNTQGIGFLRQLFSNLGTLDAGSFLQEN